MTRYPATRHVIVSLHDVAPPFEAAIRQQLAMLADIGVRRVVLKVVPNWHGTYPLQEAPALVDLLRAQVAAGSQLVLHGFEHQPHGPLHGPFPRRMRARLFAGDTAEFLTLPPERATVALRKGLACFEQLGLPAPVAFCAPGWLHNAEAEGALRKVGIRYLIGMFTLHDLWNGRHIWTPGVGYMGAAPGQEMGVQILNGIVRQTALRRVSIAKVYLHPQHDPYGPTVRRLLKELERMIRDAGWRSATYAEVWGDE